MRRRFQYRMHETDGVGVWQQASNMLMAKHLLRQCWETVRGHAFSPLEISKKQLKAGNIEGCYRTLFNEYCKFACKPASPMLLTALMYILHYHIWHWRDKGGNAELRQEVRQNFKDLLEMYLERAVEPMAIMAYIHLRDGNRLQAKKLLVDAMTYSNDQSGLAMVHMAMVAERWHPSMAGSLLYDKQDIDVKEVDTLYKKGIALEPRMAWAHKNYGLFIATYKRDYKGACEAFNRGLVFSPHDADAYWWLAQLTIHLLDEESRADKRKIKTFALFGSKLEKKRVGKAKGALDPSVQEFIAKAKMYDPAAALTGYMEDLLSAPP